MNTAIATAFAQAKAEQRAALVAYLTAWDGGPEHSLACLQAAAASGADVLEVGVPFSDPIADGPVIQSAMTRALQRGASLRGVLELCGRLGQTTSVAKVLFGYVNPILKMGPQRFAQACREHGVDGVLVVDLPPESASFVREPLRDAGIAWIGLVAPTTTLARRRAVVAGASGFIYAITLRGVTGGQGPGDSEALARQVAQLRNLTDLPVAAGFGVQTPEQVGGLASIADGVVVGSALVEAATQGPTVLGERVAALRRATAR